jgi:hypothetical protein
LDWQVVDTFQLEPGRFAAARAVVANDEGGVYVVGQAMGRQPGAGHWIVRHSATGHAGSWSVQDDFRMSAREATAAELLVNGICEPIQTPPMEWSSGLAMLTHARQVFAGGSAFNGSGHGLVRRLDLIRTTELTAGRRP